MWWLQFINCYIANYKDELQSYLSEVQSPIQNKSHSKYCPYIEIGTAIDRIVGLGSKHQDVLVHTPCFAIDSLGNKWSNYLEARICANISGLHYLGASMKWGKIVEDSFLDPVPSIVINKQQHRLPPARLKSMCPCHTMCHEKANGLMHTHSDMVRDIFLPPIARHASLMQPVRLGSAWRKTVRSESHADENGASAGPAPPIPDVAVHYRCGDNTVGPYGFLPFPAIKNRIKSSMLNPSTIYVLAEPAHRKTKERQVSRCNVILDTLRAYLARSFPSTTVLTLRGLSLYDDLVRLTLSNVTVCSVSTFCLFPAMTSSGDVYFPVSALVAESSNPTYGPRFHWMNKADERILSGAKSSMMDISKVIQQLGG